MSISEGPTPTWYNPSPAVESRFLQELDVGDENRPSKPGEAELPQGMKVLHNLSALRRWWGANVTKSIINVQIGNGKTVSIGTESALAFLKRNYTCPETAMSASSGALGYRAANRRALNMMEKGKINYRKLEEILEAYLESNLVRGVLTQKALSDPQSTSSRVQQLDDNMYKGFVNNGYTIGRQTPHGSIISQDKLDPHHNKLRSHDTDSLFREAISNSDDAFSEEIRKADPSLENRPEVVGKLASKLKPLFTKKP